MSITHAVRHPEYAKKAADSCLYGVDRTRSEAYTVANCYLGFSCPGQLVHFRFDRANQGLTVRSSGSTTAKTKDHPHGEYDVGEKSSPQSGAPH